MALDEAVRYTACPLDCPDTCTLEVHVHGGRLVKVDAAPGNPFTDGYICQKVKHHPKRVYAPERVMTPLVRSGPKGSGEFRPATWDEALDLVAARLAHAIDTYGPASVVPYLYNSSAGVLAAAGLGHRFWRALGASYVPETICAATAGKAWRSVFGGMLSADPLDVTAARLVIVWGANPTVSNIHFAPLVTAAQKAGARVAVVDPRRTGLARRADRHLAIRPGTDVVLALAAARHVAHEGLLARDFSASNATGVEQFLAACEPWDLHAAAQECGVDAGEVAAFAEDYAHIRPAFVRVGWGLERNRNGGAAYRAIFGLSVLTGQFGVEGSGINASLSEAAPVDEDALLGVPAGPARREVNMNRLGAMLTDTALHPPIAVLFVQGANPAVMNPNQVAVLDGLAREDLFTVVHEQVLTDTALYADVVLPATTHFEADDVAASYGSYTLAEMPAVIDRVGESRTNPELYEALAPRLGFDPSEYATDRLAAIAVPDGLTGVREVRPRGGTVQFRDTLPTHGGSKARLADDRLPDTVPVYRPVEASFPLALLSPATPRTINSMFGEFAAWNVRLAMNPADAAARGLADGQPVRVFNAQAELRLPVHLDADLRPGVVVLPKGLWRRDVPGGLAANALVPDALSDLAGGATFNDARVEVAAV